MRLPLPEVLLTGLLAAGFAATGEAVLRRLSRGVAEANEAMLVGMGLLAALLFPLSRLLHGYALVAELLAMGACLFRSLWSRWPWRGRPAVPRTRDRAVRLAFAGIGVMVVVFAALNFRYALHWDGFQIWASKAQLLFHSGGLTREWYPGDIYDRRVLAYPPLVPLVESLLCVLRGGFDFDRLKPVFLLFYLSLLAGTHAAARSLVSARLSALATVLVACVPALSTSYAAGAYADMPLAAFVAAATGACLSGRRGSAPWLVGALTTVKSEGMILAVLAGFGMVVYGILESPRRLLNRARSGAGAIGIVLAFVGLRLAYLRWLDVPDAVYGGSLRTATARVPEVARLCILELIDPRRWALFWPAFVAGTAILLALGSNREKALAIGAGFGLALAAAPFLFTTWPLEIQVKQAFFRLAAQLAPAAAVVAVAGYSRLAERMPAARTRR